MESRFGSRRKSPSMQPIIGAAVASFLLGGAIVGYFAWRSGDTEEPVAIAAPTSGVASDAPGDESSPTPTPSASEAAQVAEAAEAVERVAEQQGGLDQRLAAAEQRLARLDLQAQAAAGNAARAEGLLIAFATRRAVERGAELGYLADQLRLRFGDALPNAVRTIINFSRQPVTLDQLLARLEGLGPEISQNDTVDSWADIQREIGQLFVIRRESTPSPQPERRLDRARQFLESGRVDAAIAEVRNLPGADKAEAWIADAERYGDAMRAIDLVETAAVLEPRRLRDGAGNTIDQLGPADTE
ncbi:hypothetical protein P7228_10585 [Altererythrobacter arenosus]|uniref:Mitochondrial inner membrane protein n=1 Tax=Altererythrobacter arenosus TaxID=3032592 RepID=A0ABY8FRB2_9SPHN|nr:hypothetical protein [Altererythrobacter sp. CAU 1644]WFL76443.1 hypothetical protein P7228_10585 [Altererythrobacter sp. CAU 1644]